MEKLTQQQKDEISTRFQVNWLRQLICRHPTKKLVVTNTFFTIEKVATVCTKCNKKLIKEIES